MYADVPRDLAKVERKILFGLTKEQILYIGLSALVGIPTFIFIKGVTNNINLAMISLVVVASPFIFLLAFKKDGLPATELIKQFLKWKFLNPNVRNYKITNSNKNIAKDRNIRIMKKKIIVRKEK